VNWRRCVTTTLFAAFGFLGEPVSPAGAKQLTRPGVWISESELVMLPTSGTAWLAIEAAARGSCLDRGESTGGASAGACLTAKALLSARTGDAAARIDVLDAIWLLVNGRAASAFFAGNTVAALVIAADVIGLADYDSDLDAAFRESLQRLVRDSRPCSLDSWNSGRPDATSPCATTHAAVAAYLGDADELRRAAHALSQWLEASVAGRVSGPPSTATLTDALLQAVILGRAGYDTFSWHDRALLRMYTIGVASPQLTRQLRTWPAIIVNHHYGVAFPTLPFRPGDDVGWVSWTYSAARWHAAQVEQRQSANVAATSALDVPAHNRASRSQSCAGTTAENLTYPQVLEFSVSADHDRVLASLGPAVTHYVLELFELGHTEPFLRTDLGKPTLSSRGPVRVKLQRVLEVSPRVACMVARVTVIGPEGSARSAPSNAFCLTPC
jgi:hypothetical protein